MLCNTDVWQTCKRKQRNRERGKHNVTPQFTEVLNSPMIWIYFYLDWSKLQKNSYLNVVHVCQKWKIVQTDAYSQAGFCGSDWQQQVGTRPKGASECQENNLSFLTYIYLFLFLSFFLFIFQSVKSPPPQISSYFTFLLHLNISDNQINVCMTHKDNLSKRWFHSFMEKNLCSPAWPSCDPNDWLFFSCHQVEFWLTLQNCFH